MNDCKHESKYFDWTDKFIPGWDDENKTWKKTFPEHMATKYWQVKCTNCKQYIPEYEFSYPSETFTKK